MRIRQAAAGFLTGYFATGDHSPKTAAAYTCDLRQFLAHVGRNLALKSVGPEVIEGWVGQLKDDGYAPASIQRKTVTLRVFFHYWVRRGALDSSPFWRIKIRFGPRLRLPKTIAESEVKRLYKQAEDNLRAQTDGLPGRYLALRNLALLDLLFMTGIRVGEATALDLDSFDHEESCFRVRGKGNRVRLAFLVRKKNQDIQRRHLSLRRSLPYPAEALFLNTRGGRLSPQGVANVLRNLKTQAGIDRHLTPHMLRHTVASLLLRNGADLRVVQEFLGHASIVSTQRYTHVSKGQLVSALKKHHVP